MYNKIFLNSFFFSKFRPRKAKTYIPKIYQACPYFLEPSPTVDIHDYKTRPKEQVFAQIKSIGYKFDLHQTFPIAQEDSEIRRKAVITFDMTWYKFTKLQQQRLKVIMGPRFQENNQIQKITCDMYPTIQQNVEKAIQMLKELILEAKRAP